MKNKMTWGGIGPKLALITLPYLILSIFVINRNPGLLKIHFVDAVVAEIVGYTLLGIGFIFYLASAFTFLKHFKKGKLITQGVYGLSRNPIYATFIVFVIPALTLIFQSGMIFTIDIVLYLNFKIAIHGEYAILKRLFGDEYVWYEKSVNEILPIPKFWK